MNSPAASCVPGVVPTKSMEMAVQQVKIFKSVDTETDELEKQINRFIRKNNVRVLSITGNLASAPAQANAPMSSFAGGDVMVIVLFEIDSPRG